MIDFKKLAAPFPPEEVSWRVGSTTKDKLKGMALAYLDARAVMDRLDAVCGPTGWQCRYSHANSKTVCDIGISENAYAEHPVWIWKADGAGDSDIEAEKGALSDAFKRAAVRWGIGRYLYNLDSPWVELDTYQDSQGNVRVKGIKKGEYKNLDMILRRATQAILNPVAKPQDGLAQAKDDIAQMQNAGEQPITQLKTPSRLAAELWASNALEVFKTPGFDTLALKDWKREAASAKGKVTNGDRWDELREKHPDLAQKLDDRADLLPVAAA